MFDYRNLIGDRAIEAGPSHRLGPTHGVAEKIPREFAIYVTPVQPVMAVSGFHHGDGGIFRDRLRKATRQLGKKVGGLLGHYLSRFSRCSSCPRNSKLVKSDCRGNAESRGSSARMSRASHGKAMNNFSPTTSSTAEIPVSTKNVPNRHCDRRRQRNRS